MFLRNLEHGPLVAVLQTSNIVPPKDPASFHSGNPPFSNGDIYGIYGDDFPATKNVQS